MTSEEAERFGSPTAMRERVSAEHAVLGIESLWHNARGALRVFVKSPGFAFVVLSKLALGIGANTAIFELLDAVRYAYAACRATRRTGSITHHWT